MADPYVITSPCIDTKDRACVDVCPVPCIDEVEGDHRVSRYDEAGEVTNTHPAYDEVRYVFGSSVLSINPDECTSCDARRPECPVDAIYPGDQVPPSERDVVDIDHFVFADISG
ncbi:MAG: hypothetical protein U0P45_13915 [Acidimicrobiales bacterium]